MKKWIVIILSFICGLCVGWYVSNRTAQPIFIKGDTVKETEYVDSIVKVIEIRDRWRTKIEVVEKEKEAAMDSIEKLPLTEAVEKLKENLDE